MTGIAGGVSKLSDLYWEQRLGVSTRGVAAIDNPDSSQYAAMHYTTINRVLERLELQAEDVFVDIGSGKGRVLCCAARFPITKVIGVDLSAPLNDDARRNAQQARGLRAPIEVHTGYADEFDYTDATVAFLFSPFGAETMRKVLSKIHQDRGSRPIRLAYANAAHRETFDELPWLEQYDLWDRDVDGNEHAVAFYRSRA